MAKRRSGWSDSKVVKYARGIYGGLSTARKLYNAGSRTFTSRQKSVKHAPGPITGESDYRGVYRRKPMPRRRRRRWVKFTRRVKAVAEKQVPTNFTVVRRDYVVSSVANQQNMASGMTILGGAGPLTENDDIADIVQQATTLAGVQGTTSLSVKPEAVRVHITGWLAECMINNNSATATTYIDCYYWRAQKDVPTTLATSSLANLVGLVAQGFSDQYTQLVGPAGAKAMAVTDYGVTPFQSPLFSKCIRVYKKTRIKLAPGGTAQLELRSGKNYYRNFSYDRNYIYLKGCSEGILFVQYGSPDGTSRRARATDLTYSINVNYSWKRMSDDRMVGVTGDD